MFTFTPIYKDRTVKIESVRIKNFRCFSDQTIHLRDYACLLGANGSGKSTVLAALNLFFRQSKDSKTDLVRLSVDDFHHKNIAEPVEITLTFTDLSPEARKDLEGYARQGKLIVSARAEYDAASETAEVLQFGSRLGIEEFREYFEADKNKAAASDLKDIYNRLKKSRSDLPSAGSKTAMVSALQEFESNNPDECVPIRSNDQFYGATKGANRLAPHIQWVFVPAVKDITEESEESKTSGLGQLLNRTIRSKVNFSQRIESLRRDVREEYQQMLQQEQTVLSELSGSLETKLKDWAHPNASVKVLWTENSEKSVRVEEPLASIRLGERGFEGELARFGHGMQRSYMLTLLQELASSSDTSQPTLVLGIEEPELFQHPPQTRYMSEVLRELADSNTQVLVCSHSPLFVPGDDFEAVRIVREVGLKSESEVAAVNYSELASSLDVADKGNLTEKGVAAKLFSTLHPRLSEMFFCKVLVLVEGIEDVSYISTVLELDKNAHEFRRLGCHLVPVGGKSELVKPIAIARQLGIPVFVVCDADTNKQKEPEIQLHERDNKAILRLLDHDVSEYWPDSHVLKNDMCMWKENMGATVSEEIGGDWSSYKNSSAATFDHPGSLAKNPLAVSRAVELAWNDGHRLPSVQALCTSILEFARSSNEK